MLLSYELLIQATKCPFRDAPVARAQYSETYASLLAAYVNSPGGVTDGTMTPRTAQKTLALPSHMSPNMSDNASLNGADGSDARDALANLLKKE